MKIIVFQILLLFCSNLILAQAPDLKQIIEKHGAAIGGLDKWKAIKGFQTIAQCKRTERSFTLTANMLAPNKYRLDFVDPTRIMTKSYNGNSGWIVLDGKQKEMAAGEILEMAEDLDFYTELAFALERKIPLEYLGLEDLNHVPCYKIKMKKSDTDEQTYYVNSKTFLIEMMGEYSNDLQFKDTYFKMTLRDYQSFDGLLFPMYSELFANDVLTRTAKTTAVTINPPLKASFFDPPNPWLTESMKTTLKEFDFWLGEWNIYQYNSKTLIGKSKIESIVGGHGLQETYYSIPGPSHGKSLNHYNFIKKQWEQYWIDNSGMSYFFVGRMEGERGMVLKTQTQQKKTTIYHELIFKPQPDGSVRQTWQQSQDNEVWETVYDGLYKKREPSHSN